MNNEQKESPLELYVIDEIHEHTYYDTIRKYAVDKQTFKKYFPNWNYNNNSKPKLYPKRKKE
jgi:hypothetical protein